MRNSIIIGALIFTIAVVIILAQVNQIFSMGSYRKPENRGLYIYSGKEISSFLESIGYQDTLAKASWDILRNADGTELRISDNKTRKIIILSCDGSIKEIDIPGYPTWIDEKHNPVVWHDQNKGMVHYKNGMYEKIERAFSPNMGPDPSGKYFMKYVLTHSGSTPLSEICKAEIYSMEMPDFPLTTIRVCGPTIFLKDDKIYLFGKDYYEKSDEISDTITMHVFQEMSNGWAETESKTIEFAPAGLHIVDFSPWNERVFLIKDYDPPFRSILYEFDFDTKKIKKIGKMPYSGGRGFYLQCDILSNAQKKHEGID